MRGSLPCDRLWGAIAGLTLTASTGLSAPLAWGFPLQGRTVGHWGPPQAVDGAVFSGVGTSVLRSGQPFEAGGLPNQIEFEASEFTIVPDRPFSLGTVRYTNRITLGGTDVTSLPLQLTLVWGSGVGAGELDGELGETIPRSGVQPIAAQDSQPLSLGFRLAITPNFGEDPLLDADRLTLERLSLPASLDLGGLGYRLQILGFSRDGEGLHPSRFSLELLSLEDSNAHGLLYARLIPGLSHGPSEPQPIPESSPSAWGLGLGGLAWLGWRRIRG